MGGKVVKRGRADSPIAQLCLVLDGNLRRLDDIRRHGEQLRAALAQLEEGSTAGYRRLMPPSLAQENAVRWSDLWARRAQKRRELVRSGIDVPPILTRPNATAASAQQRAIPAASKSVVLARSCQDRCAFCGTLLVSAEQWDLLRRARPCVLPNAELVGGAARAKGGGPLALPQRAPAVGFRHQFEHVVPRWSGGSNDPSNLVSACGWCNAAKGLHTLTSIDVSTPAIPNR